MLRKYSFILMLCCWLAFLAWRSERTQIQPRAAEPKSLVLEHPSVGAGPESGEHRLDAIELLDRIVAYEHYYRSVYGHFTKFLSRFGVSIPASVSGWYEIRVVEADGDRLLVTAISEVAGRTVDQISIDQDYRLRSNFPLPPPRADYLRVLALKQLRLLRDAPDGRSSAETGAFRDFFRYDVRTDSSSQRVAFAVGIRPPVLGVQLELGPGTSTLPLAGPGGAGMETNWAIEEGRVGQKSPGSVMHPLEQAYLAQQIFRGEVGRYARSWSELSRIADFRFEKGQTSDSEVPFGDGKLSIQEIDMSRWGRSPAAGESGKDLIIEPIEGASLSESQSKSLTRAGPGRKF